MRPIYPQTRVHPAPVCTCHGVPMDWHTEKSRKNGGRWRCRVAHVARSKRHRARHAEHYAKKQRIFDDAGVRTPFGEKERLRCARYTHSAKGRLKEGRRTFRAREERIAELTEEARAWR